MGITHLGSLTLSDDLVVGGTETITGGVTYAGAVTLGDTSGDAITVNGTSTVNAPFTVGVDDTGHDVKFFGATTNRFVVWDESQDALILADNVPLQIGGDEATSDGFVVKFDGTSTLTIDANTSNDNIVIGQSTNTGLIWVNVDVTPNNDSGAASTIPAGARTISVQAVTNDANDWIVLPAVSGLPIGHEIIIECSAGTNFELRTPASSNEKINGVDADGTQEYLCTDTDIVRIVRHNDDWVAQSITALGAVRTAVVPD